MGKAEKTSATYSVKRYTSSLDQEFIKALKIYNDTVSTETKTDTREITHFVDDNNDRPREMYFFGLYYNTKIIGYFQCGYLKQTKTLIIDYIILGNEYNHNSIFYPLFSLVQQYFSDNLVDIDYYVMEISIRSLEENVDKESYYSRKWLTSEDFRLINVPYPQPLLGISNYESNFDLRLMIKSSHTMSNIKTNTFMSIVNDIYTNHYIDWYNEFMNQEEMTKYKEHIEEQLNKIEENIKGKQVIELNTIGSKECEYYRSDKCQYSSLKMSAAGFAPTSNNSHKKVLKFLAIPAIILLALALSVGAYFILNSTNLINENFAPFFSAVASAVTGLTVFFFSAKKD